MPNYSTTSVTTNIFGFQKTTYPEAGLITYKGNNYSIRIKTIGTNSYIEFLDSDQSILEAKLTQEERLLKIIDFTNLADKRGAASAEEYIEDIIQNDSTPQTTPVTGNSGGGGDVTVIANDTDFSTETTLAAVLAKITNNPSTASNQTIANDILNTWNSQGVPLRNIQGNAFCLSTGDAEVLSNIPNAQDRCAYLFRAKSESGGATIKSFFFSFESINSDEYEIRVSIQPEFQNWTPSNGNFSNVSDPANPLQSKLEFAQAGELGMPDNGDIQIIGYNQALGGRLIFGKRALGFETVDSRPNFELFIPEGLTFALSVLATDQGASVKSTVSWNE